MTGRPNLFFSLLLFTSCGVQVFNSSSGDKAAYGNSLVGGNTPGGQRFAAAYAVMQNNCFTCHSQFSGYTIDQDWINAGYVVADDLVDSTLYQRLKGSEVSGIHNMPQDPNPALSSGDLTTIRNWISQIGL